jgi:hypothetical protein
MQPNSPEWNKKVHGELASLPLKNDLTVEYLSNLASNLILGNYSSLAWNLLMKYFNFENSFCIFCANNFTHFDTYFAPRSTFEILDYYKFKGSIYDFFAFRNDNVQEILDKLGIILDAMNAVLERELDSVAVKEWANLKQVSNIRNSKEIFAKFIFHKAWNHFKSLVSINDMFPSLKDTDQDIIDLLISISTEADVHMMEPSTLVRYSSVCNWMIGNVLCFKGSLRSNKIKRKDLTKLSIDWMLSPIMSLLKVVVDKESRHIYDFLRNGNLGMIDEYTFLKYPWDLSRIVHFTAIYSDSGDIRRWLRKLFTLLMEQSHSHILRISDIEAFLIGCVFEMTNYYYLQKVESVQEMLYINSLHPWEPSQDQIQFWNTLLVKYSYHKFLILRQLDDSIMSGYTSDIRGGSNSCLKIYAYISFRYSRRMKYRDEPLYEECRIFKDYYLSPQTSESRSSSLWNGYSSEEYFL